MAGFNRIHIFPRIGENVDFALPKKNNKGEVVILTRIGFNKTHAMKLKKLIFFSTLQKNQGRILQNK